MFVDTGPVLTYYVLNNIYMIYVMKHVISIFNVLIAGASLINWLQAFYATSCDVKFV